MIYPHGAVPCNYKKQQLHELMWSNFYDILSEKRQAARYKWYATFCVYVYIFIKISKRINQTLRESNTKPAMSGNRREDICKGVRLQTTYKVYFNSWLLNCVNVFHTQNIKFNL